MVYSGKLMNLENDKGGLVNGLFVGKDIIVASMFKKLSKNKYQRKKHVDDFCRFYIQLVFSVFYFPRNSQSVTSVSFSL